MDRKRLLTGCSSVTLHGMPCSARYTSKCMCVYTSKVPKPLPHAHSYVAHLCSWRGAGEGERGQREGQCERANVAGNEREKGGRERAREKERSGGGGRGRKIELQPTDRHIDSTPETHEQTRQIETHRDRQTQTQSDRPQGRCAPSVLAVLRERQCQWLLYLSR